MKTKAKALSSAQYLPARESFLTVQYIGTEEDLVIEVAQNMSYRGRCKYQRASIIVRPDKLLAALQRAGVPLNVMVNVLDD